MIAPALDLSASEANARARFRVRFLTHLRLPPKITLSEWADKYRVISPPAAEAGPWRTDRVPYLREIMDTISGPEYSDLTVIKCSQSAGTEGCINNAVGYFIDQEPSSILVIQPNVKPMAEGWSKERLAPMLRDTPRLRGRVKDPRSRDSGNTVLQKSFPGGFLVAVGANSPAGLASWPIRVVLGDELDRWPASAGTEGDPLALAEARQITYRHRKKTVKVTTPGNAGESRGEKEWAKSDQRHWYVPCPHCGHEQPLEWRDTGGKPNITAGRGAYRLVWERGEDGSHRPETARYQCRSCEGLIDETHKAAMLAQGRWVKHNPASKRAGWHIVGLLSSWIRWRDIATKWVAVHDDPEQRKTFFNTLLGLLYESEGEVPDAKALTERREDYGATPDGEPVEVPQGVGALTLAVDVQEDRLEAEVRGWGEREESWQIRLERIYGDPESAETWDRVQALLDRGWRHATGATLRIDAGMVDSGFRTDAVYRWVRPRQVRRVYAYKGQDGAKSPMSRASRANKDGVKVFTVDPTKFKDTLFARLRRRRAGPGYLHFGSPDRTGAEDDYFGQFEAEKRTADWVKGRPVVRYIRLSHRRNEAIDLYVMGLAALRSLGMTFVERLGAKATAIEPPPKLEDTPPETSEPQRRGSGWVNRWRH